MARRYNAGMLPVVDSHQHLWDLQRFQLNWLKPGQGPPLERSYLPEDYTTATHGFNVVKAVYVEVDVVPEQQAAEAEFIIGLCESGRVPTCAAVIAARPMHPEFEQTIRPYRDHPIVKGVRQLLHVDSTPPGFCLQPAFIRGVQLLGELGLSFDLCIRPKELPDMLRLATECPGTQFILDHCGNPQANFSLADAEQWRRDLAALAERPNVACKISGLIANGFERGRWSADDLAPFVNAALDTFGPGRCLFGGDWPVCLVAGTYNEWLTALRAIVAPRPEAEQQALFHDAAAHWYRLA